MKKIICICICICSSFGCGRLQSGGNAENLDDTSRVVKHTPLSSDPANLPVPTPSTNPAKSPALKPQSSNAPEPMSSPTLIPSSSVMPVSSAGSSSLLSLFCSVCKIGGYIFIPFAGYYLLGDFFYELIDEVLY